MHTMVSSKLEMLLINEIEKRMRKHMKSSRMELLIQAEIKNRKKKHASTLKYFGEKYK